MSHNAAFERIANPAMRLPPHILVLYTTLFRDGVGVAFVSHNVVERVSVVTNAPPISLMKSAAPLVS
jgi:hypothetical protein